MHLPAERASGLGIAAFDLGSAWSRQAPLARLAGPVLARLVDGFRHSAHLSVLHGREVLYLVEERAPGRARPVSRAASWAAQSSAWVSSRTRISRGRR